MSLFHPPHVVEVLDRLDDMDTEKLKAVLPVRDRKSPIYVASEALVRLLRRARLEDDRLRERLFVGELLRRVETWVRRKFGGLHVDDRDEFVQEVLLRLFQEIGKADGIDFWEITFDRNLGRAAADAYQERFARFREEQALRKNLNDDRDDDGTGSVHLETWALCVKGASSVLDEEEIRIFHPMFVDGLPIASSKATIDLVRLTGIPEGTLREMKTRMTKKLKSSDAGDLR